MKGAGGVIVGLLANLFVIGVNIPFLLMPTDKPIRPMIWPAFYLLAAVCALLVGLPLATRSARAGKRAGCVGVVLCVLPLPLAIATFWLFATMHGLKVLK